MRELQQTVFPFLDNQELLAELCKALLRCGQFRLAQKYLTGAVPLLLPCCSVIYKACQIVRKPLKGVAVFSAACLQS